MIVLVAGFLFDGLELGSATTWRRALRARLAVCVAADVDLTRPDLTDHLA